MRCNAGLERLFRNFVVIFLLAGCIRTAEGQSFVYDVSTAPALTQALAEIGGNSSGVPYVINFQNNITGTSQFFINADVIINGGGYSLDMAGALGSG
ncbi:MAG: hypothetical protein EBR28_10570, partial [Planctomycetia bacterium]|nr:hypothetical protein [Planctomycetia bacterium]